MAEIRPFRAVRPSTEAASAIAALPYDVYDEAEARRETAERPLSFLCIDRAETQLPEGTDPYGEAVYEKAAELFLTEQREGYFLQDESPCYYLYALTQNGRTQTGLAACSAVSDYLNGVCKKHENTVSKKETDRIRHVRALSAQTGPIFLFYREDAELKSLFETVKREAPLYDFTAEDGVRHTVWKIDSEGLIERITARFAEAVPCTYIADGHHRAASAVKAAGMLREEREAKTGRSAKKAEYDYFLSVLFPDSELAIMDYNRIVRDLNGQSAEAILEKISAHFFWEELETENGIPREKPEKKGVIYAYFTGKWYALTLKPEEANRRADDAVAVLDVSVLQELILEPVFGIKDPRTDERISFAGGIRGTKYLKEQADRCGGAAFSLYPTSIEELMAVAEAGRLMPPKSTWFEPKLRSGLLIHKL